MREELRARLETAYDQLINLAFGLVEALLVIFIAWVIYRRLRGPIRRRLAASPFSENGKVLIENGATVLVYLVAFTLLLALWGATWAGVLAAISVSTIIVGLGLQDLLRSFAAGLFILFERPFSVGDQIKVRDAVGAVESIGLRKTTLRLESGETVTAPNSLLFTDLITNLSPYRTLRTMIFVSGIHGPAPALKTRAIDALSDIPGLEATPEVTCSSSRSMLKVPPAIPGVAALDRRARAMVKPKLARGTQIRVTWVGSGEQAVRDEVVRRLKEAFPEGQVRVQRR